MFADMTDSTKLYEKLGDTTAVEVVNGCINTLTKVVGNYQGRVIKTIGDAVMCTFPEAVYAALAASDMHLKVRELSASSKTNMQVKVGVHYGTVLEEDNDIFGDAVNVAARLASLAKPDQSLVTDKVHGVLPAELSSAIRYYDKVALKGKSEQFEVFELIWEVSDMTMAADTAPPVPRKEHSRLKLSTGDQMVALDSTHDSAVLGRAKDCQIQCTGALTSRKHAMIEYRRGRFVLTDQSVNGTYVKPDGELSFALKRDHYRLEGSGAIGLGEAPEAMGDMMIRYEVE